jgi:F0F1-type ATP synthase delta subunit
MKKDISIYFDLVTSLNTTQEATGFVCEIDNFLQSFFKSEKTSIDKEFNLTGSDFAKKITETFAKNNLDINNQEVISDFFSTLKKLIGKLKVIKLVLAFDPAHKTIEKIHNFVKETIGIGYILDIEVSEDILGGSIVIFDGKYNDFSLRKSIEEAFKTNGKEALPIVG